MNRSDELFSSLCAEIDMLRERLDEAERAAEFWRKKHDDLVMADIKHGEKMMGEVVKLAIALPELAKREAV